MENITYDLRPTRKTFSRIGWALCAIIAVAFVAQLFFILVPRWIWEKDNWFATSSWGFWISTFAPTYLFAFPAAWLILRRMPSQTPQNHKLSAGKFVLLFFIAYFVMYVGNIIGNVMSMVLSGGQAENALVDYAMDSNPLKILVMVILAPLFEEFIFRKLLIDRTAQYGEKLSVFFSAITFALLHQNLFQFFYAFGLGFIFAYIYLRTGRLRYTVFMHAIMNFMGAVIAPWIISNLDLNALANINTVSQSDLAAAYAEVIPGLIIYLVYSLVLLGFTVTGLVLFIVFFKKFIWKRAESQLPKHTAIKAVYLNSGMIVYILLCIAYIVMALL